MKRLRSWWITLYVATLVLLSGCGGGVDNTIALTDGGRTSSTPANVSAPVTQASGELHALLGGTVELSNIARVDVPAAALVTDSKVVVEQTNDPYVQDRFEETADIFPVTNPSPYEVRLDVGQHQPSADISVTLQVPAELRSEANASHEIRALYLNVYESDIEAHTSVELLVERASATATEITVSLPREAFQRGPSGSFQAYVMLGLTATARPNTQAHPTQSAQNKRGAKQALPATLGGDQCLGKSIGSPVGPSYAVSSGHGPRQPPKEGASRMHTGVDFPVPIGTDIRAVADGKISRVAIDSGNINVGYGYYVIVKHNDGSASRYAHLTEGSALPVGTAVTRGSIIAKSGNTGVSTGPHLHFEYSPEGNIHAANNRINPVACMGNIVTASLTVSDNGSAADDSFQVTLDDRVICTTSIGASNNCAIGSLRSGSYALALKVLVAPDNIGTYQITSNTPEILIDGSSYVAGVRQEGDTVIYALTVE